MLRLSLSVAVAALIGLAGCTQEEVAEPFEPRASHADYVEGLEQMDLADTAIGRQWIEASKDVLAEPVEIELPFREQLFFDPAAPDAAGYAFEGRRGRSIRISINFDQKSELRLFVDLFRMEDGGEKLPRICLLMNTPLKAICVLSVRSSQDSGLEYRPPLWCGLSPPAPTV